ncbi:hypothetical protein MUP77_15325 [Candidatus Bathyarchaeota archaeon]|nr:hypothetical protein [Candidatus Bathyarchaeota archaeon]
MSGAENRKVNSTPKQPIEEMKSIWDELQKLRKRSCLVTNFYFFIIAAGFSVSVVLQLFLVDRSILLLHLFLLVFTCALWLRLWLYDTDTPGLKCEDINTGRIKRSYFYLGGFVFSLLFILVFWSIVEPTYYVSVLATMYLEKALWHRYHERNFEESSESSRILRLAYLSDFVIALILGIYAVFFLIDAYLWQYLSIEPFLHTDATSSMFKFCVVFFTVVTTAGLEVHYLLTERVMKTQEAREGK